MDYGTIFCAGATGASRYAVNYLRALGIPVTDQTDSNAKYLLLDTPSFQDNGLLRMGGNVDKLLTQVSPDILVCGGKLDHPSLAGFRTVDFLQDEAYLCENACITAECALDAALPYLKRTIRHLPVLVIGWGRIGKCLGKLLAAMGADVTIAARNPAQRAMIHALGYGAVDIPGIDPSHYRLIYNTVPYPVLDQSRMALCREDCVKIELASRSGLAGDDVILARGLPGLHMPESSGELIAGTFLRLCYGR